MHVAAAEIFRRDDFAGRGFHKRRPGEKNRALVLHDHGFVRHRRNVSTARGARTHHARDLRNAERG
jgi:hypothetical protein